MFLCEVLGPSLHFCCCDISGCASGEVPFLSRPLSAPGHTVALSSWDSSCIFFQFHSWCFVLFCCGFFFFFSVFCFGISDNGVSYLFHEAFNTATVSLTCFSPSFLGYFFDFF